MSGIIPLLIVMGLFIGMTYLLIVRPVRQRERKHDALVGEIERGEIVITAGGMFGQVERVDEDTVILKVESGATVKVTKGGIVTRQED